MKQNLSRWYEFRWIALISLLYFVLNALRLTRLPRVWQDEVQGVEPSLNLLLGHGLTSAAHPYVGFGDSFSGPPLFFFMLWSWMESFGFSIESVRWFDVTVAWLSALALFLAVSRSELLKERVSRIAFFTVVILGVSLTDVYANTRYDLSAIFVLSIAALVYSYLGRTGRLVTLFVSAALLMFSNYLAFVYFGALVLILAIYQRGLAKQIIMVGIAGATTGVILFFTNLWLNDALVGFLSSLAHASTSWGSLATKLTTGIQHIWSDRSAFLLIAFFVAAYVAGVFIKDRKIQMLVFVGLAFIVLLPPLFYTFIHYTFSYRWMAFFPSFLIALMLVERMSVRSVRVRNYLLAICVVAIVLPGLPRYAAYAMMEWRELDYSVVDEWVAARIASSDVIMVDAPAYYPGKRTASFAYVGFGQSQIRAEAQSSISKAFLDLTQRENPEAELQKYLGGHWLKMEELEVKRGALRLALPHKAKEPFNYHIGYYVRQE